MPWVKLDTAYLRHPKLYGLPPRTVLLHLGSILWTAEHLTDGEITPTTLRSISDDVPIAPRWRLHHAERLVAEGLWDVTDFGWHVHDFEIHNAASLRANVEANRAAAAERLRRYRARSNGVTE